MAYVTFWQEGSHQPTDSLPPVAEPCAQVQVRVCNASLTHENVRNYAIVIIEICHIQYGINPFILDLISMLRNYADAGWIKGFSHSLLNYFDATCRVVVVLDKLDA